MTIPDSEVAGSHSSTDVVPRSTWFLVGALALPLSLFLHEMAHFAVANLVRAEDITFEWTAVEAERGSVGSTGWGSIAIAGPVLTLALIVAAVVLSRRRFHPVVIAIGLVAGFRSLVSLGYIIRSILGSADSGNFAFDEYDAATEFGISPLLFSVPSLAAFVFGAVWFGRRLWRDHGPLSLLVVIVGSIVGLVVYATVGPAIL